VWRRRSGGPSTKVSGVDGDVGPDVDAAAVPTLRLEGKHPARCQSEGDGLRLVVQRLPVSQCIEGRAMKVKISIRSINVEGDNPEAIAQAFGLMAAVMAGALGPKASGAVTHTNSLTLRKTKSKKRPANGRPTDE
jgi:hypothetical protein